MKAEGHDDDVVMETVTDDRTASGIYKTLTMEIPHKMFHHQQLHTSFRLSSGLLILTDTLMMIS